MSKSPFNLTLAATSNSPCRTQFLKINYLLMNPSKNLLFVLVLLLASLYGMAQNKVLKGTIISTKDDTPVSGATIAVKGTSTSVAATSDGSFSIPVNSSRVTLVITSVGYTKKELTVDANQNNISIPLEADLTTMGEVVV